jgi:hypothetical protein
VTTDAPLEQLKKVGFRRVGEWKLDAETLSCILEDLSSSRNVSCAFVEAETLAERDRQKDKPRCASVCRTRASGSTWPPDLKTVLSTL